MISSRIYLTDFPFEDEKNAQPSSVSIDVEENVGVLEWKPRREPFDRSKPLSEMYVSVFYVFMFH